MSVWTALSQNRAATHPEHDEARLRGRIYAIPFAQVYQAALQTAEKLRWTVTDQDPRAGEIVAEARTRLWKFTDDVWIRVSLDDDAQTRVDMASASRVGRGDLGTNARRIARFLHALDARLGARQHANTEQISR
ncbi:MAG TPA: DUF1499 domain-containing protein [Longimicrobium sp.]|jgi:uncharacterized protein (DUF1499 family)|uniref:DUF1499 domain-containing protein n=1 Tax=Longimicrobium sp. TaxID=2029185 RepID=UPI002ED97C75